MSADDSAYVGGVVVGAIVGAGFAVLLCILYLRSGPTPEAVPPPAHQATSAYACLRERCVVRDGLKACDCVECEAPPPPSRPEP